MSFGPRRGIFVEATELEPVELSERELHTLETFDLIYRSLCAMLYNYAPTSGHPGGSVSSGRIVAGLLFDVMDYDIGDPLRRDSDILSYAAGHKALGLYAILALRDEIVRLGASDALPSDSRQRLRFEDLLGFRRNPSTATPLFQELGVKPLDGHPTPATPFVRLATGASGVGMASSLGLALGAADVYGADAPRVHILEGEGGLTPGRVSEALAFAGSASLNNAIVHLDWNQSSIDSDRVTREGSTPGDYVQWDPMELFHLHDWNVIRVPDGTDIRMVRTAQRHALTLDTGQPTAIVYRTTKGWRYGIEGRASHGGGHALCSDGYYEALRPLLGDAREVLAFCEPGKTRCHEGRVKAQLEACYWQSLELMRSVVESNSEMTADLAERVLTARARLMERGRSPRPGVPDIERIFLAADPGQVPDSIALKPGARSTLRAQLGKVLGHYNSASDGALLVAAADLLGSTSVKDVVAGFPAGYYNARTNPLSRTISIGGIAEDAIAGVLSGVSSFGAHMGVGASYAAFLAPLGHISARLHAIGNQARQARSPGAYRPLVLVCGHAGLKTGEDGPTHADPQALQLLQEDFLPGTLITMTPWEPSEIWPAVAAALSRRPAVLAPFVTRPTETVPDREALGLAPASAAANGVYRLWSGGEDRRGSVVIQGSEVAYAFVEGALPRLREESIAVDVYYVASVELFDALPASERDAIFPETVGLEAMGVTGFTMPTLYRWVRSELGRSMSLFPYRKGHVLGSGPGHVVVAEAGLDGESQYEAILRYLKALEARRLHSPLEAGISA